MARVRYSTALPHQSQGTSMANAVVHHANRVKMVSFPHDQLQSVCSLVVREQVIQVILRRIHLPVSTVSKLRIDLLDLRQDNLDLLLLGGPLGCITRGFILTIGLVDSVIFLIIICRVRARNDRVETLESLHDVVHVDVELVSLVLVRDGRLGAATKIAGVALVRRLKLRTDKVLPILCQDLLEGVSISHALGLRVDEVGELDDKAHVAIADLIAGSEIYLGNFSHTYEQFRDFGRLHEANLVFVAQRLSLEQIFEDQVRFQLAHVIPGVLLNQEQNDTHDARLFHRVDDLWHFQTDDSLEKLNCSELDLS